MFRAYCAQTAVRPKGDSQPKPSQTVIKARAKHVSEEWPKEPPPENKPLRNAALRGVIKEYPNTHRFVRIFTSSTFTDTRVERNALMRRVYPELRLFCRERGYEMQIVDMRWGVRDEATDDHMTSELCMKEIRHCQQLSTGPNFVTFLGQKYGYRPFPPRIDAAEMTSLLAEVKEASDVTVLRSWFKQDDNAVPAQYILLPIRQKLPAYADPTDPDKQKNARDRWWKDFECMQMALRKAAAKALSEDDALKYFFSVTEEEIQHGILEAKKPDNTCYWFKRHLVNLKENSGDKMARRFMDVGTGADDEAYRLLVRLKDDLMAAKLPSDNIKTYDVSWTKNGVDPQLEEHSEYIDQFCMDFKETMCRMVEQGIEGREQSQGMSDMTVELLQHLRFAREKTALFVGRQKLVDQIRQTCSQPDSGALLVICGEPGAGKTSLMAKIASLLAKWTDPDVPILLRFLGTTALSSGLKSLLTSLCEQLQMLGVDINDGNPPPPDLRDLQDCFKKCIQKCTKRICIVLDSLDQLRDLGGTLRDWIPTELPQSVVFVLSAIPSQKFNIVSTLKTFLPESSFLDVPPFDNDDNGMAIETWFNKVNRTLRQEQMRFLIDACSKVALPLYTRLAFETAVRWRSFTPSDDLTIGDTIDEAINILLQRVERYHGEMLVQHALGYVTAAKSGLSVSEIEDVLSLDDEVLNDVYQYHMPPLRRLPPLLWVRIQADLESYLTSTGADGVVVIRWFHRQFTEVARHRYLIDQDTRKSIHETLTEYFLGTWSSGLEKPYTDRKGNEGTADRYVAAQPIVFSGKKPSNADDPGMVNRRKLSELPFHLVKTGDLHVLKQQALLNFEFLYTKIKSMSLDSVFDDLEMAREAEVWDEELELVEKCLSLSKDAILLDVVHLPTYLLGRLTKCVKPDVHQVLPELLKQAASPTFPCFISTQGHMPLTGSSLVCKLVGHQQAIGSFDISPDYKRLVSAGSDGTLREWEVASGQQLTEIDTAAGEPYYTKDYVPSTRYINDCRQVLTVSTTLHRWNLETGTYMEKIEIPGIDQWQALLHTDPTRSEAVFLVENDLVCFNTNTMKSVMKIPVDGPITLKNDTLRVSNYLSGLGAEVVFHRGGSNTVSIVNVGTYKKNKKMAVYEIYSKKVAENRIATFAVSPGGHLGILHFTPNPANAGTEVQTMKTTLDVVDLRTARKLHTFQDVTTGYFFGMEKLLTVGDHKFAVAAYSTKSSTEIVLADFNTKTCQTAMELTLTFIQSWMSTNDGRVVIVYQNNPAIMEYHDLEVAKTLRSSESEDEAIPEANILIRVVPETGSRYALFYTKCNKVAVWDTATRKTVRTALIAASMHQGQNLSPTVVAAVLPTEGNLEVADLSSGKPVLSSTKLLYNAPGFNARVGVSYDKELVIVGPKPYMVSGVDIHSGRVKWSISADTTDKLSGLCVCKEGTIAMCSFAFSFEEAREEKNSEHTRLFVFDLQSKSRLPDITYDTAAALGTMVLDQNQAALTPDGGHFIATSHTSDGSAVYVWNTREGTKTKLKLEKAISLLAYSPITDYILLTGSGNDGILLYRLRDLSPAGRIEGDLGMTVSQMWLSPDGTYCTTNDPRMRCDLHLIDVVKKKKLMTYKSTGEVAGCLFADHNKFLLLAVRNTPGIVQYYLHPGGENKNERTCAEQRRLATLAKQPDLFGKFQHMDYTKDTSAKKAK